MERDGIGNGPLWDGHIIDNPYARLLAPWNVRLWMLSLKLAPALAAGNTVVLKPAGTVCLSVLELMKQMADIIAPGVVNVITGYGEVAGQALVAHPEVRKVAFSSSIPAARKVIQYASVNISVGGFELRRGGLRPTGPINFSGGCHFNSHTRKSRSHNSGSLIGIKAGLSDAMCRYVRPKPRA